MTVPTLFLAIRTILLSLSIILNLMLAIATVQILGDSTGDITTPIDASQTDFSTVNGYRFFSSEALDAGTYVVGMGVVDVDGTGISSGLLVDNFEVVPFDFSATAGLGFVAGVFGLSRLRRRFKSK